MGPRSYGHAAVPGIPFNRVSQAKQMSQLHFSAQQPREASTGTKLHLTVIREPEGRVMIETENGLIAIIDDDRLIRRSLERLLKSAGFTAKSFDSAEDFLRVGDHNGICCIILDIGLPGMSGFELRRRLMAETNRLPVVFISARDEPEIEDKAAQSGAIAFLRKPFEDDALLNAVQTGMELLKNRRQ